MSVWKTFFSLRFAITRHQVVSKTFPGKRIFLETMFLVLVLSLSLFPRSNFQQVFTPTQIQWVKKNNVEEVQIHFFAIFGIHCIWCTCRRQCGRCENKLTRVNFINLFTYCFYVSRSQKRKKLLDLTAFLCFWIWMCKSCT